MPRLMGICGPSGSGKTTLASAIRRRLGDARVSIHAQDAYYRDLGHLPREARDSLNFDHPAALDWGLMESQLAELRLGRDVDEPVYDFREHARRGTRRVRPGRELAVVDGHLLLTSERIRGLLDLTIYLDADLDLLFVRRLLRDTRERGRTVESVCRQYLETVRPMLFEHVTVGRGRADLVIPAAGDPEEVLLEVLKAVAGRLGIVEEECRLPENPS